MDRRGFFRIVGGALVAAVGVMVGRGATADFGADSLASMDDILRPGLRWRFSSFSDGRTWATGMNESGIFLVSIIGTRENIAAKVAAYEANGSR